MGTLTAHPGCPWHVQTRVWLGGHRQGPWEFQTGRGFGSLLALPTLTGQSGFQGWDLPRAAGGQGQMDPGSTCLSLA